MSDTTADTEGKGRTKRGKRKAKKEGPVDAVPPGNVKPDDPDFALWVQRLWEGGDKGVSSLQVVPVYQNGQVKAGALDTIFLNSDTPRDAQKAVEISNRLVRLAQRHCDCYVRRGRQQAYSVDATNDSTGGRRDPHSFPLLLASQQKYLVKVDGSSDDEDSVLDPAQLILKRVDRLLELAYEERTTNNANTGDIITALISERQDDRAFKAWLTQEYRLLMQESSQARRDADDALNHALDRDIARKNAEFWIEVKRELFFQGKNLLPGLVDSFGGSTDDETPSEAQPRRKSREQLLIDNFFRDCKAVKIDIALFGDWEKGDGGKLVQTKPGIIKPGQFAVLMQVLSGKRPVDALDELLMDSGHENAVTLEQQKAVAKVPGMSMGIATSLMELFKMRSEARAKARATQRQEQTTTATAG